MGKKVLENAVSVGEDLKQAPFFQGMSSQVMEQVEAFVYHRHYDARQIIFFPDDPCDFVYWVREGRVRVTRVSDDGRELSFRHLSKGAILGEDCLTSPSRRRDYAEALAPTLLCLMKANDFKRLVRDEASLAYRVALSLARRIEETEQVLADTVFKSVRSRVAAGLTRLNRTEQGWDSGVIRVTHQELANLIGSTRETTTAVLHEFKEEGLVSMGNRRLCVEEPEMLEHLARKG